MRWKAAVLLLVTVLTLWPTTGSASEPAARPDQVQLVVVPRAGGGFAAAQMAIFTNEGTVPLDRLELPLPPTANTVQLIEGGTPDQVYPEGDLLIDQGGLAPGESRRLVVTYDLTGNLADLVLRLPHGATNLSLAVPEGIQVLSGQLEAAELTEVNGQTLRRFTTLAPLEPGDRLTLQVSVAAAVSQSPTPAQAPPTTGGREIGHTHGRTTIKVWLNLLLVLLSLGLAISGAARTGRRLLGPMPRPGGVSAHQPFVQSIATLDLEFRDGRLPEPEYRAVRSRLKEALLESRKDSEVQR